VALLRADQLVAFPTETVYGLGGHALHPVALAAIFAAKGRPNTHPLIAHVADLAEARTLAAQWTPLAQRLAAAFWPGPLTLVLPRAAHVPLELTGGKDTVAIRLAASPLVRELARALGAPIAAPSANRYQSLSPTEAAHVARGLGDRVPLILDGGACTFGLESTVVDATGARAVLLRPGALSVDALRRVVPDLAFGAAVAASEAERQSPGQDAVHYAPRAALYVLPRGEAMARAGAGAGLVLRGENLRVPGPAIVRVLPDDPQGFGHALFATLHALDAAGVSEIYVEAPPPGDAWLAVADRLKRGSRGV
jgi:L-threonylcarbamoyladenylate synthase